MVSRTQLYAPSVLHSVNAARNATYTGTSELRLRRGSRRRCLRVRRPREFSTPSDSTGGEMGSRRLRYRLPTLRRRRLAVVGQKPVALLHQWGARRRQYRRPVVRRRRLEVIRRRRLAGKGQQPATLVHSCRARQRAHDAHRSRRRPVAWHRPADASCRGSGQSRRSGGVLHSAAPSCCRVPRGRRIDDLLDLPAAPSCRGVQRGRRLDDLLGHPVATDPRSVAQSRRADGDAARPAAPSSASAKAADWDGSHHRRRHRAVDLLELDSPAAPTRCGGEICPCPVRPVPGRRTRGSVEKAALTGRLLEKFDQPATPSHSGEETLDGPPDATSDGRVRRYHRAVAPNGRRLDCPAREPAALTHHAAAATPVPLPRPSVRHLGWVQSLVLGPSCRAPAMTTVPPPRPNCRHPGSVKRWAAAPRRRRLPAILGQPAGHSYQGQEARAPHVVEPTVRTVGSARYSKSSCTAQAPRAALDDDDAGHGDAPCRAPCPAYESCSERGGGKMAGLGGPGVDTGTRGGR